jgi:class 3 adenylate cyclase
METAILERTIIKLGSLLALGFGEAGAGIVSNNMRGLDSAGVDAMIPGVRVDCIIGMARIRDFSLATEVLQGKVMTFVNQISEIVHGVVDEFFGAVNRNNGESFLLIWRTNQGTHSSERLADMSLVALATVLGAVHRSPVLARYRRHPGLQQRLGSDCRVNLTMGLHFGWAIEGAVGTEFKIDASYLSPNVSIAERLEHATRVYAVNFVASQQLVGLCSETMAGYCRLIDKVKMKGSKESMELFSIDLDTTSVELSKHQQVPWNLKQRFHARRLMEIQKHRKSEEREIFMLWENMLTIKSMRQRYNESFLWTFSMAYRNYSEGEWMVAKRLLLRAREVLGMEDGPSLALLAFMESPYGFVAPEGWPGCRALPDELPDLADS